MEPDVSRFPVRLSDEIIRPLEDVRNERVKLAVDYWNSLRGERPMPSRSEITLRGMARFVSDSVLVEVLHGGADYAFGFMGDSMVRAFNVSLTGRKMSDIEAVLPIFGGQLRELYAEAVHGHAF